MIKKNIKYMVIVLSLFLFLPINFVFAREATTLRELRQDLANLQAKKRKTENQKNWTKEQINQKNNEIINANKEINNSELKINEAKHDIEKLQKSIEELDLKTKDIMKFYQKLSSDNIYAEFITESSTMTELIMRIDAISQIVDYNKNKLIEMEDKIKKQEELQIELNNYKVKLNQQIDNYHNKIDELDSSLLQMNDIAMDINQEIKMTQDSIKNYENMKCGENEKFNVCIARTNGIMNNSGWLKPLNRGMITSPYGRRVLNGKVSFHNGIDIGAIEGTPVYSATNGKVVHLIHRSKCGGNQIFIESQVNGVTYTIQYAHLLTIDVKLNQTVTNQTVIAKSGGYSTGTRHGGYDRCTTGGHLHFGVSKSRFTTWSNFVSRLQNPPGFPGKGVWFYSRTQWFN